MLIKNVRNGSSSDWFRLTKSIHRKLLLDPPEQVIFRLGSIYPDSSNADEEMELDFELFTVLTRESVLSENAYRKKQARHIDRRPIDTIDPNEDLALAASVEDAHIEAELLSALRLAIRTLPPMQRRRLQMHLEDGLSYVQIGQREQVSERAAAYSVKAALKKVKKFWKGTSEIVIFGRIK